MLGCGHHGLHPHWVWMRGILRGGCLEGSGKGEGKGLSLYRSAFGMEPQLRAERWHGLHEVDLWQGCQGEGRWYPYPWAQRRWNHPRPCCCNPLWRHKGTLWWLCWYPSNLRWVLHHHDWWEEGGFCFANQGRLLRLKKPCPVAPNGASDRGWSLHASRALVMRFLAFETSLSRLWWRSMLRQCEALIFVWEGSS